RQSLRHAARLHLWILVYLVYGIDGAGGNTSALQRLQPMVTRLGLHCLDQHGYQHITIDHAIRIGLEPGVVGQPRPIYDAAVSLELRIVAYGDDKVTVSRC